MPFVRGKLAILERSWLASGMENRRTKNRAVGRPEQQSIQGDGRPFGIAGGSQAALVRYADIIPLLAGVNLTPDVEALLARRLRGVIADYIGPRVRAERKASHAEALKLLAAIATKSRKLERDLGQLDNDFLVLIDDQRAAIAGREQVGLEFGAYHRPGTDAPA